METVEDQRGTDVKQTKLTDIEGAAYVPPKCAIVGRQVGNWMWRSPEAHAEGQVNKPSDMFSFGIVVSYHIYINFWVTTRSYSMTVYLRCSQAGYLRCR